LSNSTGEQVNFTADAAGDYIVELIAENSAGMSNTVTVTITAEAVNTAPTAVIAGADPRNGQAGVVEYLDATGSSDAEDDAADLTYLWEIIQNPNSDTLVDANLANASYTSLGSGQYIVQLTVTDTGGLSDIATVTINTAPGATDNDPVADAGGDQTVEVGATVTLDGSNSSDVETDYADLGFEWAITSEPAGIACFGHDDSESDCSEEYPDGTVVGLRAEPAQGFVSWSCDGSQDGNVCVVVMDQDRGVFAQFVSVPADSTPAAPSEALAAPANALPSVRPGRR